MGHSYKGTAVPFSGGTGPENPVLSVVAPSTLGWTWTGPDPDAWGVFAAGDNDPRDAINTFPGDDRGDVTDASGDVYVRGLNPARDAFTTPASNVVTV